MDNAVASIRRPVAMLANAGHKPLDTRIFHKEATFLAHAGWKVSIVIPNEKSFEMNGIQIIAVPPPKKGWEQLIRCPWDIFLKAMRLPSNSIFHIHDSELLVAGIALRLLGRKVIYDAHEDTPLQISYQHWIPRYAKGPYTLFYRVLESLAGKFFNGIIVAEPVIAKYFSPKKVTLVRNFPIAASFANLTDYYKREKRMVYVGLLSKPRGIVEMLEGHRIAAAKTSVSFSLGGKFAPASLQAELLPHYTVDYREWLSYSDMIDLLMVSQIGIIVPHPIERYKTNYPVKLFEYMAAGLPVIASREGVSAEFVKEADAGILVDPENPEAIGAAIIDLTGDPQRAFQMGARGRKLILDKYNWERESVSLIALYERISK